jgi:allantoin racemase
MRLLLYNPNTDKTLTAKLAAAVRLRLGPNDSLEAVTSDRGTAFIGSDKTIELARAPLLSGFEKRAQNSDAVLLGCFGDLGVDEVREKLRRPVVSLSDGFFAIAPFLGQRIGIVTTSPFWAARLEAEAHHRNVARWITEIRPLDLTQQSADSLHAQCRAIVADFAKADQCDVAVLAGALLVAIASDLALDCSLPIVDSLAGAIALCRTAHEAIT